MNVQKETNRVRATTNMHAKPKTAGVWTDTQRERESFTITSTHTHICIELTSKER